MSDLRSGPFVNCVLIAAETWGHFTANFNLCGLSRLLPIAGLAGAAGLAEVMGEAAPTP